MQPVITKSLRKAVDIPCMIICSGTSRLVVIGGEHLPPPGEQRNKLLLNLMVGRPHGLGGEGSQANKVSVVTSDPRREAFHFHFYQVVRETGQLMDKMECSNAAAAAGLFARLSRVARPLQAGKVVGPISGGGSIHTTNTATGQKITLILPGEEQIWKHPWGVRFDLPPEATEKFHRCSDQQVAVVEGREIAYHIVPHGNVFVFCQISPREMTSALSVEIGRQASLKAEELGRATHPFLPKIIPYHVVDEKRIEAASFFEGERHNSMPGSAAMALALFVSLVRPQGQAALPEGPERFTPEFVIEHHGGDMHVNLGIENKVALYTEFYTPVRLLMHGAAQIPPDNAFVLEVEEEQPPAST